MHENLKMVIVYGKYPEDKISDYILKLQNKIYLGLCIYIYAKIIIASLVGASNGGAEKVNRIYRRRKSQFPAPFRTQGRSHCTFS